MSYRRLFLIADELIYQLIRGNISTRGLRTRYERLQLWLANNWDHDLADADYMQRRLTDLHESLFAGLPVYRVNRPTLERGDKPGE